MFYFEKFNLYFENIFLYFESVFLDGKSIYLCYEKLFYYGLLVVGKFRLNFEVGRRVPDQNPSIYSKNKS